MDTLLLIVYLVLFAFMIAWLVRTVRHGKKWLPLWLAELCAAVGAWVVMMVADRSPGSGLMPGLENFGTVVYSMAAAAAFGLLLVVSLVIGWLRREKA